uniref:NADH-ubiquinone oxidoreductase chain 3 n=1 Tax=Aradacanthia heissi TaxID=928818 RepID=I6LNM2_9HEMI|nr:NADH dehydrogenase subunit 3 [Aradacanthia heissi]
MYMTVTVSIMSMSLAIMLMIMCKKISIKSNKDREKLSPFECGFEPMSSPRMPFSIQFFLIAILFLIFDIEIAIILPMIMMMKISMLSEWIITMTIFIMILIIGLIHEWKNGMLEWAN